MSLFRHMTDLTLCSRRRLSILLLASSLTALAVPAAAPASLTATRGSDRVPTKRQIVISRNDGSHQHSLGSGLWSSVSPDDSQVAVVDLGNHGLPSKLRLVPTTGRGPTLIIGASVGRVVWSPDSSKLLGEDYEGHRLLLIDAASGALTPLATGTFDGESFSPDSTKVAYAVRSSEAHRGGPLRVLDLATGATTTLREDAARPVWGAAGIAFSTVRQGGHYDVLNIALINGDGGGFRQLTRVKARRTFFGLYPIAVSADGTRLVSGVSGADGEWLNTWGVDLVHGGARLIAHRVEATGFSRDGRYVIGQTGDVECCGFKYTNIVRVPWSGGGQRVLLRHAMSASFNG
jgi:Tol biopolymer transport system component